MKTFTESLEENLTKLDKIYTKTKNLIEALTGDTSGHRHEYDIKKSGTTSTDDGHSHTYDLGSEMTDEGGKDNHIHSLTTKSEIGVKSDHDSDKNDDKNDDKNTHKQ